MDKRVSRVLDLRGLVCPMNVIVVKKELKNLKEKEIWEIIVDFPAAKEDVPKAIRTEGYKIIDLKESEESMHIYVTK